MCADMKRKRVVAGHQPNFFPWFGYFEKMLKSDVFVFSDDVRFPSRNYVNRVSIPVNGQTYQWTLPVLRGSDDRILDKIFVKDEKTLLSILKTAKYNLGGFPHFSDIEYFLDFFAEAYKKFDSVADLNINIIQELARTLTIDTQTLRGVELGLECYRGTERLLKRMQILGADVYLSGQGAHGYTDMELFKKSGCELTWIDYSLGRELIGDDLQYSVLVGIARQGLSKLTEEIQKFKEGGGTESASKK